MGEDHPGRKDNGEAIKELLCYAKKFGLHPKVRGMPDGWHAMIKVRFLKDHTGGKTEDGLDQKWGWTKNSEVSQEVTATVQIRNDEDSSSVSVDKAKNLGGGIKRT